MKSLEFLSQVPAIKRDNFNRDSSACKSRSGIVIHSGVHRSTAFVSRPDAVASLETAKTLGQPALNGWVEATIEGLDLEGCELNALARQFPTWRFSRVTSDKFSYLRAKQGKTIVGGRDFADLASRLK